MTLGPLQLLDDRSAAPTLDLPDELVRLYGGGLGFAGPTVYANFVETIDGVVAMPAVARSNAIVSDESDADRFVMGLLRALADVVVVGSGTMLASPKGTWRADRIFPPASRAFAELRRRLGKSEHPAVAVVTAGGSFDPTHPVLETGAVILTTDRAAADIRASVPAVTEVVAVNDGDWVDLRAAVAVLRERGHGRILSEAGPTVFGSLLADGLVDELFLTVSPVLAGRLGAGSALGLVEGVALLPHARVGGRLVSVRRSDSHLFLRYVL